MNNKRFTFNCMNSIEIEISSLCNRHCNNCPVSKIERERKLLPINLFEKIMKELKEINYSGDIAFHQYNEPLLEFDHLCECIKCAKNYNPNARLNLFTNGDILTKDKFKLLKKIGVNNFFITCHFDNYESWSKQLAYRKVKLMANKLSLHCGKFIISDDLVTFRMFKIIEILSRLKKDGYSKIKKYPCYVNIISKNYGKIGSTRLNTVKMPVKKTTIKTDLVPYCYSLLHGLHISYKGNIHMCCDCCEDSNQAKPYLIGSINENNIYDLFAKKYELIQNYINGTNDTICNECYWNNEEMYDSEMWLL